MAGGDPHWGSVVSLLHFDGPNGSTTFTDQKGRIWTPTGGAQIRTDQSLFGGASGYLSGGSGVYVTTPNGTDFQFGSGAFTIDAGIRPTGAGMIVANWRGVNAADCAWLVQRTAGGQLGFSYGVGAVNAGFVSTALLPLNVWSRISVVRSGNSLYLFINGVLDSVHTLNGSLNYYAGEPIVIGAISVVASSAGSNRFAGHVDELRITKGVARYTATYALPSEAFPNEGPPAIAQPAGVAVLGRVGVLVARGGAAATGIGVSAAAAVGTGAVTSGATATPAGIESAAVLGDAEALAAVFIASLGVQALAQVGAVTFSTQPVAAQPIGVQALGLVGVPRLRAWFSGPAEIYVVLPELRRAVAAREARQCAIAAEGRRVRFVR